MKKILSILVLSCLPLTVYAASPLNTEQQDQVRQLVHQTLVKNPEIIVEAIEALRTKEVKKEEAQQKKALKNNQTALFKNTADPFVGAKSPKLTIAYFTDYNCTFCKRQDPVIDKIVKAFPQVRIVYKDLPILAQSSRDAAVIALLAYKAKPADYIPLHHKFMENNGPLTSNSIEEIVKSMGLNMHKLKNGDEKSVIQQLDQNLKLAFELGIKGTPALVFPDTLLRGFIDLPQLETIIKEELQKNKIIKNSKS